MLTLLRGYFIFTTSTLFRGIFIHPTLISDKLVRVPLLYTGLWTSITPVTSYGKYQWNQYCDGDCKKFSFFFLWEVLVEQITVTKKNLWSPFFFFLREVLAKLLLVTKKSWATSFPLWEVLVELLLWFHSSSKLQLYLFCLFQVFRSLMGWPIHWVFILGDIPSFLLWSGPH